MSEIFEILTRAASSGAVDFDLPDAQLCSTRKLHRDIVPPSAGAHASRRFMLTHETCRPSRVLGMGLPASQCRPVKSCVRRVHQRVAIPGGADGSCGRSIFRSGGKIRGVRQSGRLSSSVATMQKARSTDERRAFRSGAETLSISGRRSRRTSWCTVVARTRHTKVAKSGQPSSTRNAGGARHTRNGARADEAEREILQWKSPLHGGQGRVCWS